MNTSIIESHLDLVLSLFPTPNFKAERLAISMPEAFVSISGRGNLEGGLGVGISCIFLMGLEAEQ